MMMDTQDRSSTIFDVYRCLSCNKLMDERHFEETDECPECGCKRWILMK